jgi:cytochrome c553
MLAAVPDGGTEPIGERILEVPENLALTELRDDASGFVAYVPPGSIARGDELVHVGKGDRAPCVTCHGAALEGSEIAPRLAGRSPSYLFRQLFDMREGARSGPTVVAMQAEVNGMSDGEMRAIVAYLASLRP